MLYRYIHALTRNDSVMAGIVRLGRPQEREYHPRDFHSRDSPHELTLGLPGTTLGLFLRICLEVRLGEFRTFHEGKNEDVAAILGEWSRLWEAYRPKLFEYVHFPALVRTNAAC